MYRGFKIEIGESGFDALYNDKEYKEIGETFNNVCKSFCKHKLSSFLNNKEVLDGSAIQEEWFPNFEPDIFISHSHSDRDLAIALSGWLYKNFNIKAFVDSCVWGNSNELLKEIDDIYCTNGEELYDYNKRNFSTSHVHMMLSSALTKMIDNCEALFFLNTPNSLTTNGVINQTESPWIYNEILISQTIKKKKPYRPVPTSESRIFSGSTDEVQKALRIKYNLDTKHLTNIKTENLIKWQERFVFNFFESDFKVLTKSMKALDLLYDTNPINDKL